MDSSILCTWWQWIIPRIPHGPCWGYHSNCFSLGTKWELLPSNHTPCDKYSDFKSLKIFSSYILGFSIIVSLISNLKYRCSDFVLQVGGAKVCFVSDPYQAGNMEITRVCWKVLRTYTCVLEIGIVLIFPPSRSHCPRKAIVFWW